MTALLQITVSFPRIFFDIILSIVVICSLLSSILSSYKFYFVNFHTLFPNTISLIVISIFFFLSPSERSHLNSCRSLVVSSSTAQ